MEGSVSILDCIRSTCVRYIDGPVEAIGDVRLLHGCEQVRIIKRRVMDMDTGHASIHGSSRLTPLLARMDILISCLPLTSQIKWGLLWLMQYHSYSIFSVDEKLYRVFVIIVVV
jgi:hypothetical protein